MNTIGSSSDYSAILEDMLLTDVNEIRKSAIMQHLGSKMETSQAVASEISSAFLGDYQMDCKIPEGSTISVHV